MERTVINCGAIRKGYQYLERQTIRRSPPALEALYMNFETYFLTVFFIVAIYVALGNYLYFAKVLPTINAAPKFLPTEQFKDIKQYLTIIEERGESYWFCFYLKHFKIISIILIVLMIPTFLHIFGLY